MRYSAQGSFQRSLQRSGNGQTAGRGRRRAAAVAAAGLWGLLAGCPADPGHGGGGDGGGSEDAAMGGSDGGTPDLRPSGPVSFCSPDGWCWRNPLPHGNPLNAVFAAAPDRIWAVGDRGLIVYYDGTAWAPQPSGTTSILNSLWGTDASTIWAAGTGGTIL